MAVNVLLPLLIPLGEQINNGTGPGLAFSARVYDVFIAENDAPILLASLRATSNTTNSGLVSYAIVEGTRNGTFALDSNSGKLTLQFPLDYETQNLYELAVSATLGTERAFGRVIVHVQDVNDHPPAFARPSYETQITEEDDRHLPKKILQVSASDGDATDKNKLVYSLSGEAVSNSSFNIWNQTGSSSVPDNAYFAVNSSNGEIFLLKALNRDAPTGRSKWALTVGVTDGENHAQTSLLINVKDINDNAPFFPLTVVNATVEENGREGEEVTQVEAIDLDDPQEGSNAILTFSLEKNVIDEDSGRPIFDIDSETGRIATALCCLDREKTSSYSIQVVATDGGGLKGTGTVLVKVEDKNDTPPMFVVPKWEIFVHESSKVNESLALLSIEDPDITNNLSFKVIPGSGHGWDRFRVLPENSEAGSLVTLLPLDYEDPNQREGFKFKVQVTDKGDDWDDPLHQDSSWVVVNLMDDNDNTPVFQNRFVNLTLSEDTPAGLLLTQMFATDVDNGGMSRIFYSIDPASDPLENFAIDSTGQIRLRRPLDRETCNSHEVQIIATDEGVPQRSATSYLLINVTDVNDNAPLIKSPSTVLLQENKGPEVLGELILDDKDDWTLGHGPPFEIYMDSKAHSDIKESFAITFNQNGDEGRGSGILRSLLPLDREEGKIRYVPLVVTDSQGLSSTVTLPVTIGDVNDNPMSPGTKRVKVLRLKNVRYRIPLGRVYVQDPDDWDAEGKVWQWASHAHPMFILNTHSGNLVAESDVSDNEYTLKFRVSDKRHHQNNVRADVFVTIETLDVDAKLYHLVIPLYVGSHSTKQLITTNENGLSPLTIILEELKSITKKEVRLLALEEIPQETSKSKLGLESRNEITDNHSIIWFTTDSEHPIDQFILMKKLELSEKTKVKFNTVGIGICAQFLYHHKRKGFKGEDEKNYLQYSWITDANATALITPKLEARQRCNCKNKNAAIRGSNTPVGYSQALQIKTVPTTLASCEPNPCLNGGRCILSDKGPNCICPSGTEEVFCKQTSRRFTGNGWAWVAPLSSCSNLHVSLEFRTKALHGVLFFTESRPHEYFSSSQTFRLNNILCLEIKKGLPNLFIKIGMKKVSLNLNRRNGEIVPMNSSYHISDGEWHRIDLFWNENRIDLLVDLCQRVPDQCHLSASIPSESFYHFDPSLNFSSVVSWNSPFQIGGLAQDKTYFEDGGYLPPIVRSAFQGCIQNLRINGKITDLGDDILQERTLPGCHDDETCSKKGPKCQSQNKRCPEKWDRSQCSCKIPLAARKVCNESLAPSTLSLNSLIEVSPSFTAPKLTTSIQLRFRTWNPFGQILLLKSESGKSFILLYLFDGHLCSLVILNASSSSPKGLFSPLKFTLCLLQTTLNDGEWHSANFHRNGNFGELWADGGDWPIYNSSLFLSTLQNVTGNMRDTSHSILHSENSQKQTLGEGWDPVMFTIHQDRGVCIAGQPVYDIPESKKKQNHYFDGCLDAIYIWGRYLPLPLHQNDSNWVRSSESESEVQKGCLNPPVCFNITCPEPMKCINIWKRHKCSCGEGRVLSEKGSTCLDIDECLWNPCLGAGTCVNQDSGYSCICPSGFSGKHCESFAVEQFSPSMSIGVLIGSLTCSFIVFGLLAFFIYLRCKKRRRKSSFQTRNESDSVPQVTSSSFVALTDYSDVTKSEISDSISWKRERRLSEIDISRVDPHLTQAILAPKATKSETCEEVSSRCKKNLHKKRSESTSNLSSSWNTKISETSKQTESKTEDKEGVRKKIKVDKRPEEKLITKCEECLSAPNPDDLRNYAYEGNASTSESLSSCCSSGDSSNSGKFTGGFQEVATLLNCLSNDKDLPLKQQ